MCQCIAILWHISSIGHKIKKTYTMCFLRCPSVWGSTVCCNFLFSRINGRLRCRSQQRTKRGQLYCPPSGKCNSVNTFEFMFLECVSIIYHVDDTCNNPATCYTAVHREQNSHPFTPPNLGMTNDLFNSSLSRTAASL